MPKTLDDKQKRLLRRKNHIKRDLLSTKYSPKIIPSNSREAEDDRRFRRYKEIDPNDE